MKAQAAVCTRFDEGVSEKKKRRGQYETLCRTGHVLACSPKVRFLISDQHAGHNMLADALLGKPLNLPSDLLKTAAASQL